MLNPRSVSLYAVVYEMRQEIWMVLKKSSSQVRGPFTHKTNDDQYYVTRKFLKKERRTSKPGNFSKKGRRSSKSMKIKLYMSKLLMHTHLCVLVAIAFGVIYLFGICNVLWALGFWFFLNVTYRNSLIIEKVGKGNNSLLIVFLSCLNMGVGDAKIKVMVYI